MAKQIEGVAERIIAAAKHEFLDKGYADASLRTIAAQLENVDWASLEQSTGDMLAQAQRSLTAAEEALTAVNDAAEKLDVEGLNTAVTDLLAVMQPLAEFFARFK